MTPAELIDRAKQGNGVAKHGDYLVWCTTYDRGDGTERHRTAWRWGERRVRIAALPEDLSQPPTDQQA
jgi:hypothetical protein